MSSGTSPSEKVTIATPMGYFHFEMGQNSGNPNEVYNCILKAITYITNKTRGFYFNSSYIFLDSVQEWGNFTVRKKSKP